MRQAAYLVHTVNPEDANARNRKCSVTKVKDAKSLGNSVTLVTGQTLIDHAYSILINGSDIASE